MHDVRIEIRRGPAMVDPDLELAVVTCQLVQRLARVLTRRGQITVRVQAIDMPALD
jgi:hypothetical protein